MPVSTSTTVAQIGSLSLHLTRLKVGQLKKVRAELKLLLGLRELTAEIPSDEHLAAMVTLVHVSASVADPSLSMEKLSAEVDDLPYDVGLAQLAKAVAVVMERSGLTAREGATVPGEAPSPAMEASSISSGSTE